MQASIIISGNITIGNMLVYKLGYKRKNFKELEKGSRFTELMHLPYYNCVRFAIIDPMHNLFLGTAKRTMEKWIKAEYLSKRELETLQERLNKCVTTS